MNTPDNRIASWATIWAFLRDILLFLVGVTGIAWETTHPPSDPSLLVLFAGCIGLPVVLQKDKK